MSFGDDLILIHGFPLNRGMWDGLVRELSGLRVHTPDLPGFGDAAIPGEPPGMGAYAVAVLSLLDELGIEKAVLGGLSMGGYVLFEFFHRYPDRVAGLVLMNTRADPDDEAGRRNRDLTAHRVRTEGLVQLADAMIPKMFGPAPTDDAVSAVRRMIEGADPNGVAYALEAMRDRADSTTLLGQVGVPALVVAGSDDQITPSDGMREMASRIPDARFVEVASAGHLAPLESAEEVARHIRRWMAEAG